MGTWGTGTVENDTAVDWMYGLGEVPDLSLIEGTLDRALAAVTHCLRRPTPRRGSPRRKPSRACWEILACETITRARWTNGLAG